MTSEQVPHRIRPAAAVRVGLCRSGNGTAMSQRAAEVQQSPMFSAISLADREKIVSSAREEPFPPRETVFLEGDSGQRISTNRDDHRAIGMCLERRKIVASYLAMLLT